MSSNPGQALWGGVVAPGHAAEVARRLMDDAMFSGWGIRTLSAAERRYNPVGYHLGTVWPHDNSLIAAGLRAYGFDAEARRVFTGIFEAAPHFVHVRLPELFAGFSRGDFAMPAHYPVACHPQAWAAGAIPYLLRTALGLAPDAAGGTLRVIRPDLPPFLDWVDLRGLRVGKGAIDLRFTREDDRTRVDVVERTGSIEVKVEENSRNPRGDVGT
jgi:glycogen debranching enzyme